MKRDIWRLILAVVGIVLAAAGAVCVVVMYWDKISAATASLGLGKKHSTCPEFDDFDDGPLSE